MPSTNKPRTKPSTQRSRKLSTRTGASALIAALAVVISACGSSQPAPTPQKPRAVALTTQQLAARAKYALAFIKTKDALGGGYGSGVVIAVNGQKTTILTAAHVTGPSMRVSIGGQAPVSGRLVGNSGCRADLALVEIPTPPHVTVMPIRGAALQVGEHVVAMGYAGTQKHDNSPEEAGVKEGEISRADVRNLSMGKSDVRVPLAVQTTAAINPGDSGGALVSSAGQLVGINVFKDAGPEVDNTGYALPAEVIRQELPLLRSGDRSQPGWDLFAVDGDFPYRSMMTWRYPELSSGFRSWAAGYLHRQGLRGVMLLSHDEDLPAGRIPELTLIQSIDGTDVRSMTAACDVWQSQERGGTVRVTGLRFFSGGVTRLLAPYSRRIHIPS